MKNPTRAREGFADFCYRGSNPTLWYILVLLSNPTFLLLMSWEPVWGVRSALGCLHLSWLIKALYNTPQCSSSRTTQCCLRWPADWQVVAQSGFGGCWPADRQVGAQSSFWRCWPADRQVVAQSGFGGCWPADRQVGAQSSFLGYWPADRQVVAQSGFGGCWSADRQVGAQSSFLGYWPADRQVVAQSGFGGCWTAEWQVRALSGFEECRAARGFYYKLVLRVVLWGVELLEGFITSWV